MEQQDDGMIEAQGMLIKANPLLPGSIGIDGPINWIASDGDPTSVAGASLGGNAFFDDNDEGVRLTENNDNQTGYLYWTKNYDYTKSIIITATTRAGGGDGADGITIFFGGSDVASKDANYGNIAVYADEFNGDVIQVFNSGSQKGDTYIAMKTLDDSTYNYWEVCYDYVNSSEIHLYVRLNGRYVTRVNIAPWTPGGNYIGIAGATGAANNIHSVKSFAVKSAKFWKLLNL